MRESSLWLAQCGDDGCWPCDSMGQGGRLVEAPSDWDAAKIIRILQIQGWTCEAGGKIEFVDPTNAPDLPEIHLFA